LNAWFSPRIVYLPTLKKLKCQARKTLNSSHCAHNHRLRLFLAGAWMAREINSGMRPTPALGAVWFSWCVEMRSLLMLCDLVHRRCETWCTIRTMPRYMELMPGGRSWKAATVQEATPGFPENRSGQTGLSATCPSGSIERLYWHGETECT
jgi:hypothetical protein